MEPFFVISVWQWWVFGILLILAEAIVPQAFLMWIGLSAVFTGSVAHFKPELGTFTLVLLFVLSSSIVSSIVRNLGYKNAVARKKTGKKDKAEPLKKTKTVAKTPAAKTPLLEKKPKATAKAAPKGAKKNTRVSKQKNKKS